MTISTTNSSVLLAGTGSQYTFNYNFIADEASDVVVYYIAANGTQTLLVPSQYSITQNAPAANQLWGIGGTITYPLMGSAIAAGTYLLLQRILPLTQETSVQNQGNYYAQVTEQALDILEMQIQQLAARTGQLRGVWATNVQYNGGDVVVDGPNGNNTGNYYACAIPNLSGTWSTDLAAGDWSLAINMQIIAGYATSASASASSAATSATSASASASSASTSATSATSSASSASTSATSAAASAAAANSYAVSYSGTSSTTVTIGTGAQTFTTQANKLWVGGQILLFASAANPANYMHGSVTLYSGTSITMNITDVGGSGSHSDWNISISGTQGTAGPSGSGNINAGTMGQVGYYATSGNTISGATAGVNYSAGTSALATGILKSTTSTGALSIAIAADFPTLNQSTTGNAATVTTINGRLTSGTNTALTGAGTSGSPYAVGVTTATSSTLGVVKPDNSTITISGGVLSAATSPFTAYYDSGPQTVTGGSNLLTLTHSLGQFPKAVYIAIRCTTTDNGFSVGDELIVSNSPLNSAPGLAVYGYAVTYNSSSISLRSTPNSNVFAVILNAAGNAGVALTNSSWALYVRAWA